MAAGAQSSYVRTEAIAPKPAPLRNRGIVGWLREHLFSSWLNIGLTLIALLLIWWIVPALLNFLIFEATWSGIDRNACLARSR